MSKELTFDTPLNSLSFGNVSISILRECYKRDLAPNIFPLQGQVDISSQKNDEGFNKWLAHCVGKAPKEHSRDHTSIKLWHITDSLKTYSKTDSRLITFWECNDLQPTEKNILLEQDKIYVTNRYTQYNLKNSGVLTEYLPLGFDSHNFEVLGKRPGVEGVITTILLAKLEHRKHTLRQLALWAKKYGNQKGYQLNAAIFNPFIKPEIQQQLIANTLEGRAYWNITFLPFMKTNAEYNSFLQSGQIVLACSGSEGYGLGEYHATAMGAWPVALQAHAYLDYFSNENAVWVKPNAMIPIYDGVHFAQGQPTNQGSIFTFADEDWYAGTEEAVKKAKIGLNIKGFELQKQTYAQTVDILLKDLQ